MIGSNILNASISELKRRKMASNISLEKVAKRANRAFITYFVLLGGLTYLSYTSIDKFKENALNEIRGEMSKQKVVENIPVIKYETIDTVAKEDFGRSSEIAKKYGVGNDFVMCVNKNNNYVDLVDVEKDKLIYRFKTSDGRNPGVKENKSDGKTPEGIYKILNAEVSDNPYFGKYKIVMDYPNEEDKRLGRDGNGILICGPGNNYRKKAIHNGVDASNGSILLDNNDLKKLYDKTVEGRTLIVIEDDKRPIGGV